MYANLVGFDDGLWSYVQKLDDDVCRRLTCLVLGRVDTSINVPGGWPEAPFDCMYMARVVNQIGRSREVIRRAIDGDWQPNLLKVPGMRNRHLSRFDEACAFAATIQNGTAKAIVEYAIQLCTNDAADGTDRPTGDFDMVYFAKMIERAFSTAPGNLRLILAGEGWKLDWE